MPPVPLNFSGSSSAYGQTGHISVGGASFGAPRTAVEGILQQVIIGVVVAVIAAMLLKSKG